ncbi:MAG: hypothetical protein GX610_24755 [Rhodococcus sp.]|nr:hypothetical protein [Rhodococcus sp. (in: high G+C Gram-positive bacteria)]
MTSTTSSTTGPLLDRHVKVLCRPDGRVQLGWDPERAVVVSPPSGIPAEDLVMVLQLFDGTSSWPHIVWSALRYGATPDDMSVLLAELSRAGLVGEPRVDPIPDPSIHIHGRGPLSDGVAGALSGTTVRVTRSADGDGYSPSTSATTCVVLADDLVVEPTLAAELVRAGTPHLHTRLRDGCGVVGPLVLPGRTSCLRCADLLRATHDQHWPHLAAQLLGSVGTASAATILATTALTIAQIDAICTPIPHEPPAALDSTLEIGLSSPRIVTRRWAKHRQCSCRYLAPDAGIGADLRP